MKQWPCSISYLDQALKHTEWKHKIQNTMIAPQPTIHIDIAGSCVLRLLFLRFLSILSGYPIINIHSCHQDRKLSWVGLMDYHPHTGFRYSNHLAYLACDYVSCINIFQHGFGWVWVYASLLGCRNIYDTKWRGLGTCLHLCWLTVSLHYCSRLNVVMEWKVHIEKMELSDT